MIIGDLNRTTDEEDVEDTGSEEHGDEEPLRIFVLYPTNSLYNYFWWVGVLLALIWAFMEPYKMVRALSARPEQYASSNSANSSPGLPQRPVIQLGHDWMDNCRALHYLLLLCRYCPQVFRSLRGPHHACHGHRSPADSPSLFELSLLA